MGLDQYAFARKGEPRIVGEYNSVEYDESNEIAYWRKHPNLQGWMEDLYREKGGDAESFNCVDVELTLEDLDCLEHDIREGILPSTTGFFFGSDSDEYYKEQDLEFVNAARDSIRNGYTVVYTSWW
ncbi:MAG: phosphoglycerate kinase [Ilumatobacteraceae bacterium]